MLRYYAVATGLVLVIVITVTAWMNRDLIRIRIASVNVPMSPKPAAPHDFHGTSRGALRGDAPWALSALPNCMRQRSEASGSDAFVRAHIPAGVAKVPAGTVLHYGPCTISVRGGEAYVSRGPDRLRIPPHVQFYRAPGVLVLLRSSHAGSDLRIYDTRQ